MNPRYVVRLCLLLVVLAASYANADKDTDLSGAISVKGNLTKPSPGLPYDHNPGLQQELLAAYVQKKDYYTPRTKHLREDGTPQYINRLIREDSPYLLQHAHNPVNWFPWGVEAFELAESQQKPIFLSIGYSTCHWCHVMERESFEDEGIARELNESYISIKVDREQLPDIDSLYMTALTMINGTGGWPMSSFLDHEGRTFYAGTYFPPKQFSSLLQQIQSAWLSQRSDIEQHAARIASAVQQSHQLSESVANIGKKEIDAVFLQIMLGYDDFQGGFGTAPKFPQETLLLFLLDYAERNQADRALEAADFTLQRMSAGGIHDHVAGGFHRYAIDPDWRIPHFEKMLYNQANLARAYSRAYTLTGNREHARTAHRILNYTLRELRSDNGLFYSATDAESEGIEGQFFTWNYEELNKIFNERELAVITSMWGVTSSGHLDHRNIIHQSESIESLSEELSISAEELVLLRDEYSARLKRIRDQRVPPLRDEKIITAWNGMMISALAQAADLLNDSNYLDAAMSTASTLWSSTVDNKQQLWRTQFKGKLSIQGRQTDYAFFAEGLLELYDATQDEHWLKKAQLLTDLMIDRFWDDSSAGFFMAPSSSVSMESHIRPKDLFDASMASGNAVALNVLSRLFKRTGERRYQELVSRLIRFYSGSLAQTSGGLYYLIASLSDHLYGEISDVQYGANGKVIIDALRLDENTVHIVLSISEGWHVNSHSPLQDYLIPTKVITTDQPLSTAYYPEPIAKNLGFESGTLSLYEGENQIVINNFDQSSNELFVRLQACNDEVCLPPETIRLTLKKVH